MKSSPRPTPRSSTRSRSGPRRSTCWARDALLGVRTGRRRGHHRGWCTASAATTTASSRSSPSSARDPRSTSSRRTCRASALSAPLPGEHSIDGLRRLAARLRRPARAAGTASCSGTRSARSSPRRRSPAGCPRPARSCSTRSPRPRCRGPNALGTRLATFYYRLGAALPERSGILRSSEATRHPRRRRLPREDEGPGAAPLDPQPARPLLLRLREPPRRRRGVPRLRGRTTSRE